MNLEAYECYHMLGIGGIGVSGVARVLAGRGYDVQGSDVRASSITDALQSEGISVEIGHADDNLDGADVVVVSTAIPDDNEELEAARERGLPIVHRSEVLDAICEDRRTIGVTGTHGKGTVASMIAWILEVAGWEPGFVIGGFMENFETNARDGDEWMVVEVDESDGSHLNLEPEYAVCNFLEVDHLNYYDGGLDDIIDQMARFLRGNEDLREAFINLDCQGNRELVSRLPMRPTGYSTDHHTEYRASLTERSQMPIRFEANRRETDFGEFELAQPGLYNVVNAVGAIAVCDRLGVPMEAIKEGLRTFRGLENRFTISSGGGVTIVKDYISHPTGIEKVLESAQDLTDGTIYSVFKPYRYTLIDYLKDEYGKAFAGSDRAVITEMYAADEDPIPDADSQTVVDRIRDQGVPVEFIRDEGNINKYLLDVVEPGDLVIFFGGDDFFDMAEEFEAMLARQSEATAPTEEPERLEGPLST